jgi:AraC-like ligand binding domain
MSRTVRGVDADSLERSSSRRADSIRFGPKAYGVERAEVYLSTCAFSPHRHDTYAIGVTTAGVQTFGYRGSRCVCLPGQLHVLHPDEAHDGAAGTEDGFSYRILYIAPELIRGALAGRAPLLRRAWRSRNSIGALLPRRSRDLSDPPAHPPNGEHDQRDREDDEQRGLDPLE